MSRSSLTRAPVSIDNRKSVFRLSSVAAVVGCMYMYSLDSRTIKIRILIGLELRLVLYSELFSWIALTIDTVHSVDVKRR